jgi:hypothetical protein
MQRRRILQAMTTTAATGALPLAAMQEPAA